MCDPAVFLETAGLFALPTPMGLFLPSQQPLRESPKLPALRADVFAKVRARHLGFLLLSRRGVQNPSILTIFSVFPHLPQAAGLVHSAAFPLSTEPAALGFGRIFRSPARRRNIRFLGFRWARARLCLENRTQPPRAAHAGGRAVFCCACWNASNRFRMRSCSHSASSFASFCS